MFTNAPWKGGSPAAVPTVRETPKQAANRERLLELVRAARGEGGDARRAVLDYVGTGTTLQDIAGDLGESRSDLSMCLGRMYGRRYERIRRALEPVLGLAPMALDQVLDLDKELAAAQSAAGAAA